MKQRFILPPQLANPNHRFPTSIDKIRLFCPFKVTNEFDDYMIYKAGELPLPNSNQRQRQQQDVFLFQHRGEERIGVSATWRNRYLRVRISTTYAGGRDVFCWSTFNPARLLYGVNTRPITMPELAESLHLAQSQLEQGGLLIDIWNAKLSLIEYYRDVALPRPVSVYWHLFHRMDAANNTYKCARNYPTGMRRGNDSAVWCLYDKKVEVHFSTRLMDVAHALQFLSGPNVIRIERRLRNAAVVKRLAHVETVGQLLHSYHTLPGLLDVQLLKGIFREPEPTSSALHKNLSSVPTSPHERWEVMLLASGVKSLHLKNLLVIQGYDHMIEQLSWRVADKELAHSIKQDPGTTASKVRKELRRHRLMYALSEVDISYAQLYAEVYRATFALEGEKDGAIAALLPFEPLATDQSDRETNNPKGRDGDEELTEDVPQNPVS